MSCASAKTAAKTELDAATYASSILNIGSLEETSSSAVTLRNVKGKLSGDLSNYTSSNTTGSRSIMIETTQGADGSSNVPSPIIVTAPPAWRVFTTVFTLGGTVTTDIINDQSIDFTIADCGTDTTKGWSITDQKFILAIKRKKTATVARS